MMHKGFIAVDMDGTALVQKIDKNPLYGLKNPESNLRQFLIMELLLAQEQGFDIYVLTARPELVDKTLNKIESNIGTTSTLSVIKDLEVHGIKVKGILRAPGGLKGGVMSQTLDEYTKMNSEAKGILLDDQLIQVNDVEKHAKQENKDIAAFDINSLYDMPHFHDKLGYLNSDEAMMTFMNNIPEWRLLLEKKDTSKEENSNYASLQKMYIGLNKIEDHQHFQDLKKICDELLYRLIEADYRKYQPDIDWINNSAESLSILIRKLANDSVTLSDTRMVATTILPEYKSKMSKRGFFLGALDTNLGNKTKDEKYINLLSHEKKHADLYVCNNRCELFIAELLDKVAQPIINNVNENKQKNKQESKSQNSADLSKLTPESKPKTPSLSERAWSIGKKR